MSICSAHRMKEDGCELCGKCIEDVIPNFAEVLARALASGISKCAICGFEHYNTIQYCPQCSRWNQPDTKI